MNSFKIALKNINKCRNDYSVYFLTLIIGVSIFYMFNSIGTQGIMEDVSKSGNTNVQTLVSAIGVISVAVAFVLGLLIIYANNFLIKRRKKEFGIYMILGMGRKKVSRILISETCVVGLVSLIIGLLVGIFGSQLLSIIVAKMFAVDVSTYTFAISKKAVLITIISFAAIFFSVLLLNTGMVAKYKLIDLINAEKKREKIVIKNEKVSIILFILSAVFLATGYIRIGFYGEKISRNEFVAHACIIVIGTIVLFWAFAGFFQGVVSGNKRFYRKGLNSFVIRQFGGNINTSAISMALMSLLLLAAICAFSSGFSFRTYLNKRLGNATPVDLTMRVWNIRATDCLAASGLPVDDWAEKYIELPVYESCELTMADTLAPVLEDAKKTFMRAHWESAENVMKLSDYNRIEKAFGRAELVMEDDQYAIVSDFDLLNQFNTAAIQKGNVLTIDGKNYTPAYDDVIYEYILLSGLSANMGVIVLPDSAFDHENSSFTEQSYLLVADYKAKTKEERYLVDAVFMDRFGAAINATQNGEESEKEVRIMLTTKNQVEDASIGTSVIVVFLVLYIGIVFVVACAAVIALKVLSDCIDSAQRFRILSRIGADEEMRSRALFMQVLMTFLLPLSAAAFGAVFILRYIRGLLSSVGMVTLGPGIAVCAVIMLLLYGGYFLTTYESCRKMI
ncbi:MAG: ABC transporter permease [Lachnospiraceae bacterium]|nr:ABC transporter permease [Lachnospiraceae bacterium]